ncbi:MAG: hypothetical protein QOJ60_2493 [Actinomycetota bacterium]|nr:hypothetical protein [Actinomycetota bacterium]
MTAAARFAEVVTVWTSGFEMTRSAVSRASWRAPSASPCHAEGRPVPDGSRPFQEPNWNAPIRYTCQTSRNPCTCRDSYAVAGAVCWFRTSATDVSRHSRRRLQIHDQPLPPARGSGHPRTQEAAKVLLRAVPGHPTTCGKAERFQQTMKKWLRAQPVQPSTIPELQSLLDTFRDEYNHRRPHRSLPHRATPAARYNTLPKALPGQSHDPDTHDRIRHDRVDKAGSVTLRHNGRLHHIGVGRTYQGTCASCSSRTSRSASSTPSPASSCATSSSTHDATTNPPADHPPHKEVARTCRLQVRAIPMS